MLMRLPILAALALAAGCERRATCPPADKPAPPPAAEAVAKVNGRWQVIDLIPPQDVPAAPPAGAGR